MLRHLRPILLLILCSVPVALAACGDTADTTGAVSPEEARAIAEEAFVYGFPMVDSYRILNAYFGDPESPDYKGEMNVIHNYARVYTPEDRAVQTPNSDTPYSFVGFDLRAEPLVLTIPPIEPDRYFSVQLVDAYTFNFDYIGTRTTGSDGGRYLLAGADWTGDVPDGIDRVYRSETQVGIAIYRTQLFDPDDLEAVKEIQAGFEVEPLSAFLGEPAPAAAPAIEWLTPLSPEEQRTSLAFFDQLNAVLAWCPVDPSEVELRERFARIGIEAGETFDPESLSPEMREAIEAGIADAWAAFDSLNTNEIAAGEVTSGDMFGTREFLQNNYLYRMAAAVTGIWGNTREEAMYPIYQVDANGDPLDGSKHAYRVHAEPGVTIPADAFWSLTMYEMPESLLYANEIDRYLINSPMVPDLVPDPDGGVTIYLQHESPGADKESNWLPAPDGPFVVVLRLYLPGEAALEGDWAPPPLEPAGD